VAKIKVAELFYSLQGEGYHVGVPSIFLRTFGCNFTCGGFGMAAGNVSMERDMVAEIHAAKPFKDYKDLPLVSTGCDSYASWDPRFKDLSPVVSTDGIAEQIHKMLPGGTFSKNKHMIFTGGEPLLGWQRAYPDLLDKLVQYGLTDITFETNGSQKLQPEFKKYLDGLYHYEGIRTTWSISAKLQSSSGEKFEEAIRPDLVSEYLEVEGCIPYFKFVVANEDDIVDVKCAIEAYKSAGILIPIYLMAVGGVVEVYNMNERQVADYALANGYRFSPRLQVPLYKNAWGT
jgi:organic radical activating enzyme